MRKTSRAISLLLALCMALSLIACGQQTEEAPAPQDETPTQEQTPTVVAPVADEESVLDAELQRAYDAGLLSEAWLGDMDAAVTFSEYSKATTRAVELWDAEKLSEWENITRLAAAADEPMDTEDGYLMLSYLWVMMGKADNWWMSWARSDFEKAPRDVQERQLADCSWDYPYFPDWETQVYPLMGNANYMGGSMMFPSVMSLVSGETIFPYDVENQTLHLSDPLSRDTAVRALLRLLEQFMVELDPDWAQFIPLEDVGTYDRSILTDALLNAPNDLPEVTQAVLPSEWKGMGISARKAFASQYLHFDESDVRFLAENGCNFTRLFLSFQTFRYPDYEQDARTVNENELRELDRLLAWCLDYGVHLQIAMNHYMDENGFVDDTMEMPQNDAAWALTRDYWAMLARRYAGIPPKYLTFDLCNEVQPWEESEYAYAKQGLASVVAAIREADPDRVLLYSQQDKPGTGWTEIVASLGVAIGCHPYTPTTIITPGNYVPEFNPYADPCWPLPCFPTGEFQSGRGRIALTGAVDDSELGIHVWDAGPETILAVYADGQEIERFAPRETHNGGSELYTVHIPAGTKKIELAMVGGPFAQVDTIILERNGIKTVLTPTDVLDHVENRTLLMTVNGDGTYQNSEGTYFDADSIYERAVKPYRDIAERYGVGFVCNEWGVFAPGSCWKIDLVTAIHEEYLNMLEKYNIGWCFCEEFNTMPKHLRIFYGNESQWDGATVEEITYTFDDGHTETVKYCKELLDQFRAHTMK